MTRVGETGSGKTIRQSSETVKEPSLRLLMKFSSKLQNFSTKQTETHISLLNRKKSLLTQMIQSDDGKFYQILKEEIIPYRQKVFYPNSSREFQRKVNSQVHSMRAPSP